IIEIFLLFLHFIMQLQTANNLLWSQVAQLLAENQMLHKQLAQLWEENTILQAQVGPLLSGQDPAVPLHEHFDGNCQKFKGLLEQCYLLFLLCPQMHPTDEARVGLVISLLARKVLDWVSPLLKQDGPVLADWNFFLQCGLSEEVNDEITHVETLTCLDGNR
uniref:DUF4939 domain-containing protein n=1 Tax=Gopherus agassizii TaxID=38772 RepID=A0A452I589_9SAUR